MKSDLTIPVKVEDLFGSKTTIEPISDRRVLKDADGRKIILVGFTVGKKCSECENFYRVQYAKVYRRCKLYPKKNWKSNLVACSKFLSRYVKEGE